MATDDESDACILLQQDKLAAALGFYEMCCERQLIISVSDIALCLYRVRAVNLL